MAHVSSRPSNLEDFVNFRTSRPEDPTSILEVSIFHEWLQLITMVRYQDTSGSPFLPWWTSPSMDRWLLHLSSHPRPPAVNESASVVGEIFAAPVAFRFRTMWPSSSIYRWDFHGFSITHHPFGGTPIYGNPHMSLSSAAEL